MNKKCNNCGHVHTQVPQNARPWKNEDDTLIGFFWECSCNSTMYINELTFKPKRVRTDDMNALLKSKPKTEPTTVRFFKGQLKDAAELNINTSEVCRQALAKIISTLKSKKLAKPTKAE